MESRAALALSLISGIGPARHAELAARHGSTRAAFARQGTSGARRQAMDEADALIDRAAGVGARLLVRGRSPYPARLAELHAPPPVLWARGSLALFEAPCVAIVGTRHPTAYGERAARALAAGLASAGAAVVSGMALGIDGVAHVAALDAGAGSVAVLGTGVDVAYPRVHTALHRRLGVEGLVVSEEPPGARPTPGSFPKRNRIIAALASVVIVVEADVDSGALITAGHGLDIGRTVAAVPGPIDSPRSKGTNRLLRDGAMVIADPADALALLGLRAPAERDLSGAPPAERAVWRALECGAADLDALVASTDLPLRDCLAALTALELAGAVECAPTGMIIRR
ncbi:MAG TPA: DNA-processing protein DprA [Gemmatimonadaceae bacterium]|nr:DNA-processing protein DprA [Gemmatimonadaceae bacterium]